MEKLDIVVNIPLCEKHCPYCNVATCTCNGVSAANYVKAICQEIENSSQDFQDYQIRKVLVTGGSVESVGADGLKKIYFALKNAFDLTTAKFEVDLMPYSFSLAYLDFIRDHQIDIRVGYVTSDFNEHLLLKRPFLYSALDMMEEAVKMYHFEHLTFDVLYGIPTQTSATLKRTLDGALFAKAETIRLLPLAVNEVFKKEMEEEEVSLNTAYLELYEFGKAYLLEHGFKQVAINLFTRNDLDLERVDTIGFGINAYTRLGDVYYTNTNDFEKYLNHSAELAEIANTPIRLADDVLAKYALIDDLSHFKSVSGSAKLDELVKHGYFNNDVLTTLGIIEFEKVKALIME